MDDEMDPEVIFDALWSELEDDPDFEAFANSPYVSGAGGGNMALRGDLDTFALHLLIDRVMDVGLRDGAHAVIIARRMLHQLARLAD